MISFNPEVMTVMEDPLFKAVWFQRGGTQYDYRRTQRDTFVQVQQFLWAFARWEILTQASSRGIVADRHLSTLVPAKVRQWAADDLVHLGYIEHGVRRGFSGWMLTAAGRQFMREQREAA